MSGEKTPSDQSIKLENLFEITTVLRVVPDSELSDYTSHCGVDHDIVNFRARECLCQNTRNLPWRPDIVK